MAEWFNASVLKTDVAARLPRVRLPLFPVSIVPPHLHDIRAQPDDSQRISADVAAKFIHQSLTYSIAVIRKLDREARHETYPFGHKAELPI